MPERRSDPRYPVKWPVRAGHRAEGCLHGHVLNFSGAGLLFTAPGQYDVNELVEMEITVNPLFLIRCAARIVRAERTAEEEAEHEWAYGATFHSLSEQEGDLVTHALVAINASHSDDALSFRPKIPLGAA